MLPVADRPLACTLGSGSLNTPSCRLTPCMVPPNKMWGRCRVKPGNFLQQRCAINVRAVAHNTPFVRWPPVAGRLSKTISKKRTMASMSINIPMALNISKLMSITCSGVSRALRVLTCNNIAIGFACFARKSLRPMLNTSMWISHNVLPIALHIFICFVLCPQSSVTRLPSFRTASCAVPNASIMRTLMPQ